MNRRVLLMIAAGCAMSGVASADLVNGGFESGLSGWDPSDASNVAITDGIGGLVYEGELAARLSYTHGAEGVELNQQISGLTPGAFYEVSGMINVTAFESRGWAVSGLQINLNDSKYDGLLFSAVKTSTTNGWEPFAVEFLAPSDGEVWVNTMWYGMDSGEAFIDAMTMRTTPAPGAAGILLGGLIATPRRRAR